MVPQELINFDWFLISALKFIKRYAILLSVLFVIGGVVGFTYVSLKKPIYDSQLVAHSSLVSGDRMQELMYDLGENIRKKNFNVLSIKMSMPLEEVSQLRSLECEVIEYEKDRVESEYENFQDNCILVSAETNSIESIRNLQAGLTNYINQNEFIQMTLNTRRSTLEDLYKETNNEIEKLDELQNSIVEAVKEGNDLFYLADKSASHFDKLKLIKERMYIQEQIEFLSPFVVISPFTVPENPKSFAAIYTVVGALIFLMLGVMGATVREVNAQILS